MAFQDAPADFRFDRHAGDRAHPGQDGMALERLPAGHLVHEAIEGMFGRARQVEGLDDRISHDFPQTD